MAGSRESESVGESLPTMSESGNGLNEDLAYESGNGLDSDVEGGLEGVADGGLRE